MKKIIELAEALCNVEGYVETQYKEPFDNLSKTIKNRRKLEQTPITEEWLKEHGWEDCDTDDAGNHHWYYLEHGTYGIEVPIFCTEDGRWYIRGWDFRITTLAQLLDAMELCGITID